MKPIHEVWASIDSCGEHWGWEDIEKLDPRIKIPTDPSTHRYIYTADQLRQAKVEVLREAAKWFSSFQQIDYHGTAFAELHRMADAIDAARGVK